MCRYLLQFRCSYIHNLLFFPIFLIMDFAIILNSLINVGPNSSKITLFNDLRHKYVLRSENPIESTDCICGNLHAQHRYLLVWTLLDHNE